MAVSRRYVFILFLILVAMSFIGLTTQQADTADPDTGRLHLAGATALLSDVQYPIVQRPPFYSAVLALLASLHGVNTTDRVPVAQELGNLAHLEVSTEMLNSSFLRWIMATNLILWGLSVLILVLTLRVMAVSWRIVYAAVILTFTPSSWRGIGLVSETPFTAFLLSIGVYALVVSLVHGRPVMACALAGIAFAFTGLTHATFQFLSPLLAMIMILLLWRQVTAVQLACRLLVLMLPYVVIVGGWSIYNYSTHGFLGVSGVAGVALSTHTPNIVERSADVYPAEAVIFARLRDETYLTAGNKDDVSYWGARASNWLMAERDMSYIEANQFLVRYNLAAIQAAPLNYLDTVFKALLGFHYPGVDNTFSPTSRLLFWGIEFMIMSAFLTGVLLWGAAHTLARVGFFEQRWRSLDSVFVLCLAIYAYTATINSMIDIGKPEQRFSVHFLLILLLALSMTTRELKPNLSNPGEQ